MNKLIFFIVFFIRQITVTEQTLSLSLSLFQSIWLELLSPKNPGNGSC